MIFLKFPCFLYNPEDVGNLISSSSPFSNPSLDIWKFLVHIMLKPSLQDFEYDLTRMGNECDCPVINSFFGKLFLGIGMRIDLCQSCGHCWVFQICGHNECKTLMASSFRDLNSPAGISWHPLALLAAVLLKAHLTSHSRMSGYGCLTTPP